MVFPSAGISLEILPTMPADDFQASKGPIYKRTDDAQRTDCFSRFRDSTRYLLGHVSRSWTTYQLLGFNSIFEFTRIGVHDGTCINIK